MDEELIRAQIEFNDSYKEYTDFSMKLSMARTKEEQNEYSSKLEACSERFNNAYKRLRELKDNSNNIF